MSAFDAATSITLAALPPPTNAQGLSFLNRKQAWTMLAPPRLRKAKFSFAVLLAKMRGYYFSGRGVHREARTLTRLNAAGDSALGAVVHHCATE
jgi:hypothetical protein